MTPEVETWESWTITACYNLPTRRSNGATDVKRVVEYETVYPLSPSGSGASLALDRTITGRRLASLQPHLCTSRVWKDHSGQLMGSRLRVAQCVDIS